MSRHPKRAPRRASAAAAAAAARANAPSSPAPHKAPKSRTPRRARGKSAPKLTKSDVERGQEVTVKGPKNEVWCGEIVRVRANARSNELIVRWFDATRVRGGAYPLWDCQGTDVVDVKSVLETHRRGHYAPPKGGWKVCTMCLRAKTTCANRADVIGDDVEL